MSRNQNHAEAIRKMAEVHERALRSRENQAIQEMHGPFVDEGTDFDDDELVRSDIPDMTPEERLLWAIFGGPSPEQLDGDKAYLKFLTDTEINDASA